MQVLEELHEQPVLWYREGHSVSVCHLFEEYLGSEDHPVWLWLPGLCCPGHGRRVLQE